MRTWNVLAVLQIKTKTISRSQTLQNGWIIKQTVVLLWKFWRKYGSVSYLFILHISNYFLRNQDLLISLTWSLLSFVNLPCFFLENQLMKLFTLFSSRSTSIDDGEDEVEDDDSDEIMVATIHQNYQSHNRMTKVQTMS